MGGAVDKVADFSSKLDPTGLTGKINKSVGVGEKKKKKKITPAMRQAAKNKAAAGAAPLLQQTALSPDDSATGAGTALL
jgi:hypothetical protein